MTQAKAITCLFGLWGIPYGFIYSLGVLFEDHGGKVPPVENAEYLRGLALYFLEYGQNEEVRKALHSSLRYVPDSQVSKLYQELFGGYNQSDTVDSSNTPIGCTTFGVVGGAFLIVILLATLQSPQPSHTTTTLPTLHRSEKASDPLTVRPIAMAKSQSTTQIPIKAKDASPLPISPAQHHTEIAIVYPPTWRIVDKGLGVLTLSGEKIGCQISWKNVEIDINKLSDIQLLNTDGYMLMRDTQDAKTREELSKLGKIIKFSSKPQDSIGRYKTYSNEYRAIIEISNGAASQYTHYYITNFICGEKRLCSITYFKFGSGPISTKDRETIIDLVDSIRFQ